MVATRRKSRESGGTIEFHSLDKTPEKAGKRVRKRGLLAKYQALARSRPLLMGSVQQTVIVALAAITKQLLSHFVLNGSAAEPFAPDFIAVAKTAVVGCQLAFLLKIWYWQLEDVSDSVVVKTALDQGVMAWFFNFWAYACFKMLDGVPVVDLPEAVLTAEHVTLVCYSWVFWIPVKALIFHAVPPAHQVLCSALGSYVWNVFMCIFLNR